MEHTRLIPVFETTHPYPKSAESGPHPAKHFRFILIFSFHRFLGFPTYSFICVFPPKPGKPFARPMHTICPTNHPLFYHSDDIW